LIICIQLTGFTTGPKEKSAASIWDIGTWSGLRVRRNFEDMLNQFESHVQLTVAEYAPRRVFVHAGVVAWKGAAILIRV
jgi:hypothetical protein